MAFGATLRLVRQSAGFTLRELAARIGVSSAYLSRVENGLDPVPTEERLERLSHELDVPLSLLLEGAHRVSPLAIRYAEQNPQAASLYLELARRDLDADGLAEVRAFITRRFPMRGRVESGEPLAPEGIRLQAHCGALREAIEVGCMVLDGAPLDPAALPSVFGDDVALAHTPVGHGVAVPWGLAAGVRAQSAVVTLRTPLRVDTPDGVPVSVVVLLLSGTRSNAHVARIAGAARLAARGLASTLQGVRSESEARRRITALE